MAKNSLRLDAVEPHTSVRVMPLADVNAQRRESLRAMGRELVGHLEVEVRAGPPWKSRRVLR